MWIFNPLKFPSLKLQVSLTMRGLPGTPPGGPPRGARLVRSGEAGQRNFEVQLYFSVSIARRIASEVMLRLTLRFSLFLHVLAPLHICVRARMDVGQRRPALIHVHARLESNAREVEGPGVHIEGRS
eukprot:6049652-Pyramimonas_sp.AAC.1